MNVRYVTAAMALAALVVLSGESFAKGGRGGGMGGGSTSGGGQGAQLRDSGGAAKVKTQEQARVRERKRLQDGSGATDQSGSRMQKRQDGTGVNAQVPIVPVAQ